MSKLSEDPKFHEAVTSFQEFLVSKGYSGSIFWVFREDLWIRGRERGFVLFPSPTANEALAKKVYQEGRGKGVEIKAVAQAGRFTAATVWFPKFPEDEIQGWPELFKLSIVQPLPIVKSVGNIIWKVISFLPSYRRNQSVRNISSIGTRNWASQNTPS